MERYVGRFAMEDPDLSQRRNEETKVRAENLRPIILYSGKKVKQPENQRSSCRFCKNQNLCHKRVFEYNLPAICESVTRSDEISLRKLSIEKLTELGIVE